MLDISQEISISGEKWGDFVRLAHQKILSLQRITYQKGIIL